MSWISDVYEKLKKEAGEKAAEAFKGMTKISIDFRNETDKPIHVVMDNDREKHDIAPHGQATFSEAHIMDAPTFRVIDQTTNLDVFSRRINAITTAHASLGWNGTEF